MRSRKLAAPGAILALIGALLASAVPVVSLRGQDTTAAPSAPGVAPAPAGPAAEPGTRRTTPGAPAPEAGPPPATQEEQATQADELLARVRERFDVHPLRNGVLLSPKYAPASVGDIEVGGGGIAVGGRPVTGAEIDSLLGPDDAGLVLRLSYLDPQLLVQRLPRVPANADTTGGAPRAGEIVRADTAGAAAAAPEAPQPVQPPEAPVPPEPPVGDQVRFGGDVSVPEGETVLGDVVAIGGSVDVAGHVLGDVVSIGGTLRLHDTAVVNGNAVSVGGRMERDPAARVLGQTSVVGVEVPFVMGPHMMWAGGGPFGAIGGLLVTLLWIALLLILGSVFLLAMRRHVERVETNVRSSALKAGIVGFLAQVFFLPVYVIGLVLLVITIIGIPIAVLWAVGFFVLGFVAALFGFTAVARSVGGSVSERLGHPLHSPHVALLIGLIVLFGPELAHELFHLGPGLMDLVALVFAILGFIVLYAAVTIGFGAAILTRFGTRTTWSGEPPAGLSAPAPPPPPAPVPPAGESPEPAYRALPDASAGRLAEAGGPEPPRLSAGWDAAGEPAQRNEGLPPG
jgi:hypothetical protein